MSSVISLIQQIAGCGDTGLCSCEKYNTQTNQWTEFKSVNKCRAKFASVVTPNKEILIIGGKRLVLYLNLV